MELLATETVGRVVATSGALPVVVPVNYVMDGEDVVFRTSGGQKLEAALDGAIVAFEVDRFDSAARTGWSVVVTGRAQAIMERGELARVEAMGLEPWVPGEKRYYVRVAGTSITGRRITAWSNGAHPGS